MALDTTDRAELDRIVASVGDHAGLLKVGMGAYATFGPRLISELASTTSVFVDLKLHDIPMQVATATRALVDQGAALLTVHAAGGPEMIAAAVDAADAVPVVAVTILTSIDDRGLAAIGMNGGAGENVVRLATLAVDAGAAGVVCSPLETARLRSYVGAQALLVTPGIRSATDALDDQARTATARDAVQAGADVIVVGRPITKAEDPAAAATALIAEIS
ncbi:MAG: orotidine-5'-phosphate decarboxylase [Actinomycetota bacterium]|nr:orotidine-5'-phosphate decarboxylase [Actinomycetota bacterium]